MSRTEDPDKRPELDLGELGYTAIGITRENDNWGTGPDAFKDRFFLMVY